MRRVEVGLNEWRGWMERITGCSERLWNLTWREIRELERGNEGKHNDGNMMK